MKVKEFLGSDVAPGMDLAGIPMLVLTIGETIPHPAQTTVLLMIGLYLAARFWALKTPKTGF